MATHWKLHMDIWPFFLLFILLNSWLLKPSKSLHFRISPIKRKGWWCARERKTFSFPLFSSHEDVKKWRSSIGIYSQIWLWTRYELCKFSIYLLYFMATRLKLNKRNLAIFKTFFFSLSHFLAIKSYKKLQNHVIYEFRQ